MKYEEVIPALKEGKKIRRKDAPYIFCDDYEFHIEDKINSLGQFLHISSKSLFADDWEIIEEPKKKKKVVYYVAISREDNHLYQGSKLFKNENDARTYIGKDFIRLLTEYPIEIEEEE